MQGGYEGGPMVVAAAAVYVVVGGLRKYSFLQDL